jgi:hypothetical protein
MKNLVLLLFISCFAVRSQNLSYEVIGKNSDSLFLQVTKSLMLTNTVEVDIERIPGYIETSSKQKYRKNIPYHTQYQGSDTLLVKLKSVGINLSVLREVNFKPLLEKPNQTFLLRKKDGLVVKEIRKHHSGFLLKTEQQTNEFVGTYRKQDGELYINPQTSEKSQHNNWWKILIVALVSIYLGTFNEKLLRDVYKLTQKVSWLIKGLVMSMVLSMLPIIIFYLLFRNGNQEIPIVRALPYVSVMVGTIYLSTLISCGVYRFTFVGDKKK